MNKSLLTLSAVCLLIVASCSKSKNDPEPDKEQTCKVKLVEHTYTSGNGNKTDKYYYSYDGEGRITRVDYGKEQSNEVETFTYTANKVTWKGVDGDVEVYNLDANGRITTVVQGDDILKFKYNTDGQLIEVGTGDDIETFTYLNGNLVTSSYDAKIWMSLSYGGNEVKNSIVYAWVFGELLDYDEIGYRVAPFIGKLSKNLPSKIIYEPGADQTTANLTYTSDASGKLTSVKMVSSSGTSDSFTSEYKFTYECK
ncbi:hypothetical protein CPT03_19065 [Pedobacter ginsengisoli]|uniref:DUF4595 domain-containing protein n=1 Tax=Pedobacter ginsengisoli TaxID=363852 RepID=A0A2D1U9Y1_9SPHI|nr:DUF4595 domain-containing protein [Pedobacter ginsengisoli]ATP58412.1 hypothetical protein CPT03_19065 [Pedobacter ginsengisoli]